MSGSRQIYISITGLRLKRPWHVMQFYRHAIPSMHQARASNGNISADAQTINGVHHTLSVWESREQMMDFLYSGAHLQAMKLFGAIATGKTFGYYSDKAPDWTDVHRIWLERSNEYDAAAPSTKPARA